MPNYGTIPSSPTRFPNGLNVSQVTDATAMMGFIDPSKHHTFFDDLDTYNIADWVITKVGLGTNVLTPGDGGLLLVTNAAGATDSVFHQITNAGFLMAANKRAFFKARFKVSEAILSVLQFGLIVTNATPLNPTDGIYMIKNSGAATVDVVVRKDATTGSVTGTNVTTLVNDTFVTFAWAYNGKDEIEFYFNDVKLRVLNATSLFLPDVLLTPSFGIQNGSAVARNMTVDYIFAAIER